MLCFSGCWRFVAGPCVDEERLERSSQRLARLPAVVAPPNCSLTPSGTSPPTLLHQLGQRSKQLEHRKCSKFADGAACQRDFVVLSNSPTPLQPPLPTRSGAKNRGSGKPVLAASPVRSLKQKALGVAERWPGAVREVGALAERCTSMLNLTPRLHMWPMSPRSCSSSPRKARSLFAEGNASGCNMSGTIVSGTIVEQPKDGSCLFHSIAHGLDDRTCSSELRRDIAAFIAARPSEKIANTSIEDWVKMVTGQNHQSYAKLLADPDTWGGDLELAVATRIMDVNINVFEPQEPKGHFRCIASFGRPGRPGGTVDVVYHSKPWRHYDALLVDDVRII